MTWSSKVLQCHVNLLAQDVALLLHMGGVGGVHFRNVMAGIGKGFPGEPSGAEKAHGEKHCYGQQAEKVKGKFFSYVVW